jgi:hypothetical protein
MNLDNLSTIHILTWPTWLENLSWFWTNPKAYNFWSSSFGEFALKIWVLVYVLKHLNCHSPGCIRIGTHHFHDPDTGEIHKLCKKHHPYSKKKKHWWSKRRVHSLEYIHNQIKKDDNE